MAMIRRFLLAFFLMSVVVSIAAAQELQIYFIDVEGGQSTLIITPAHESLLIDAGFPGNGTFESKSGDPHRARDASRIAAVASAAGLKQIDYLLITHFHADHDGGVPELSQLIPIRTFVDHGGIDDPGTVEGTIENFDAYAAVRAKGKHIEVKPGDVLSLKDVHVSIVSSAGRTLHSGLPGAGTPNPGCKSASIPAQEKTENPRSTGFRLDFGQFRFADLGDLSGDPLWALFCPADLLGPLDVYLLPHHGGPDAANPATFGKIQPRTTILNNGATKGGAAETFAALQNIYPYPDVWQLHRSANSGAVNFVDERIANLDESTSYWIKVRAKADGSFQVTNARTGSVKSYSSHQEPSKPGRTRRR
jgi:beta-lactamase superfamily II metal-dependent hydrolase